MTFPIQLPQEVKNRMGNTVTPIAVPAIQDHPATWGVNPIPFTLNCRFQSERMKSVTSAGTPRAR